jgi:hypothetical protein
VRAVQTARKAQKGKQEKRRRGTINTKINFVSLITPELWKRENHNEECDGCVFWSLISGSCDYMYLTYKRRPCPPGKRCTVRRTGQKEKRDCFGKAYPTDMQKGE